MKISKDIITERVDDIPLLMGIMDQMELSSIIDAHVETHGNHKGLSIGSLTKVWLCHILSEYSHKLVYVRDWVEDRRNTIESLLCSTLRDTDFTDDRLSDVLCAFSNSQTWSNIEADLSCQQIRVYDLKTDIVRLDSTYVKMYHKIDSSDSLLKLGHSNGRGDLLQFKIMLSGLDQLGTPLASDIVAGNKADQPLYIPAIKRSLDMLKRDNLLFVGDSKLSTLANRAYIVSTNNHYLSPLAFTSNTIKELDNWIDWVLSKKDAWIKVYDEDPKEPSLIAEGLEFTRLHTAQVDGKIIEWEERVLLARSTSLFEGAKNALQTRLGKAIEEIYALTPPPKRGVKQFKNRKKLKKAIEEILNKYGVNEFISINIRKETKPKSRYVVKDISKLDEVISKYQERFAWRAYVTSENMEKLSFQRAIKVYRDEWSIERDFNRLKNRPLSIAPVYLKRDDHIIGMARLLTIALRILTIIETRVRQKLSQKKDCLKGLYKGQPKKSTTKPTTERLLKAFQGITLTIFYSKTKKIVRLTSLSNLQTKILNLLKLPLNLYSPNYFSSA